MFFLFFLRAFALGQICHADVVINEILYDAAPDNDGGEFIEILNTGPDLVDLGGWVLSEAVDYTFPSETNLGVGDYALVARDKVAAETFYGVVFTGEYFGSLSNGGEVIVLLDNNSPRQVHDVVAYDDEIPWPLEADGGGPSLVLLSPLADNSDLGSWSIGRPYSPGAANVPGVINGGDIAISEIMYKPHRVEVRETFDRVSGGTHIEEDDDEFGEYVEICNRGTQTVDLEGWTFSDGIDYTFESVSLAPGEYLLVCAEPDIMNVRLNIGSAVGPFIGALRDGGERLTLSDENGDLVDTVSYNDTAPFPVAADEFGYSIEVIDIEGDNGNPANWRAAVQDLSPWQNAGPGASDWFQVTTTGQATSNTLYFYVNGPGEWLIDDISVTSGIGSGSVLAHYRFEEGSGNAVINDVNEVREGTLVSAAYSSDTPGTTPAIASNDFSANLTGSGFARVTERPFVLHAVGGDATVEWFMKVPSAWSHKTIFWSNSDDDADFNRFNISWNPLLTNDDPERRYISGDYRGADGLSNVAGNNHDVGSPITLNRWTHVAIVRTETSPGTYLWRWYFDGVLSDGHTTTSARALPTAASWLIAGRSNLASLEACFDEIRMTRAALLPDQFLIGVNGEIDDAGVDVNLFPNPGFVANDSGWTKTRTHSGSFWTDADSHEPGNGCEHLVATGAGSGSGNSISFANVPGVVSGQTYTLSFWAKYLSGTQTLTARFSGGGLLTEVTHGNPSSDDPEPPFEGFVGRGTPGGENSVTAQGVPPLVTDLRHLIEKPTSGDPVPVIARVRSDVSIDRVDLLFSLENSASVLQRQMHDDGFSSDGAAGDGVYGYVVPAQGSQTIIHYRVRARDVLGRETVFPYDGEPSTTQAYYHYNGEINTNLTHYDLYLTDENLNTLVADPRSDRYVDASLVVNGIAYPHIGVRKRGRGTRTHPKHQWKFRFNRHDNFRGDGFNDRPFNGDGDRTIDCMLNQPYAQEMGFRIMDRSGAENFEHDLIRVHRNNSFFGVYVAFESPNSHWLRKHGFDAQDEVYKPRSSETPGRALNADYYHNSIDTDLEYWGVWNKKIRSLERPTEIRELVDMLNDPPEEEILSWASRRIDVEQWYTRWSDYVLLNIDDFTTNNHFLHLEGAGSPGGGRWKWYSYDFDSGFTHGRVGSMGPLYGDGRPPHTNLDWMYGRWQRLTSDNPTLSRVYFLVLQDMIDEVYDMGEIFAEMDALFELVTPDRAADSSWGVMRSSTTEMKNVMNSQRSAARDFLNTQGLPGHDSTPGALPAGGSFVDSVTIFLLPANGYAPYYTVDGTDPRLSLDRKPFQGSFDIEESVTLKVAGLRGSVSGGDWTRVNTYEFEISRAGVGPFLRGDCNQNHRSGGDLGDPMRLLWHNFGGAPVPPCRAACDVDGDGSTAGVADAISMLRHSFAGGVPPVAPFPSCEVSENESDADLGCGSSVCF